MTAGLGPAVEVAERPDRRVRRVRRRRRGRARPAAGRIPPRLRRGRGRGSPGAAGGRWRRSRRRASCGTASGRRPRARPGPVAGDVQASAPAGVYAGTITATCSRSGDERAAARSAGRRCGRRRRARRGPGGPSGRAGGRRAPTAAGARGRPATSISSAVPTSSTIHGRSAFRCGRSRVCRHGRSTAASSACTALSASTFVAPGDGYVRTTYGADGEPGDIAGPLQVVAHGPGGRVGGVIDVAGRSARRGRSAGRRRRVAVSTSAEPGGRLHPKNVTFVAIYSTTSSSLGWRTVAAPARAATLACTALSPAVTSPATSTTSNRPSRDGEAGGRESAASVAQPTAATWSSTWIGIGCRVDESTAGRQADLFDLHADHHRRRPRRFGRDGRCPTGAASKAGSAIASASVELDERPRAERGRARRRSATEATTSAAAARRASRSSNVSIGQRERHAVLAPHRRRRAG